MQDSLKGSVRRTVVGGMGQALYGDIILENGPALNPSFLDDGFPAYLEMPQIEAVEVETDDPIGPFGAREAWKKIQLLKTPVIVNAVSDFIGIDFMDLPITAEKILGGLEENSKEKV